MSNVKFKSQYYRSRESSLKSMLAPVSTYFASYNPTNIDNTLQKGRHLSKHPCSIGAALLITERERGLDQLIKRAFRPLFIIRPKSASPEPGASKSCIYRSDI